MNKNDDLQSLQVGHRARLRKKFLAGQLTEYEMLELLLTYAIPRRDVRNLSRRLYAKYKSIYLLLSAPTESLVANEGVKENTAAFLKLIHEIMVLEHRHILGNQPIFYDFNKLLNYCKTLLIGKPIEEFHVLYLDNKYALISDILHSSGTINWAAVYVREIAKKALDLNSRYVILLHNHPSGATSFSTKDIQITQEVSDALKNLDIHLYDHLLVSGDIVYSARNLHLLK